MLSSGLIAADVVADVVACVEQLLSSVDLAAVLTPWKLSGGTEVLCFCCRCLDLTNGVAGPQ